MPDTPLIVTIGHVLEETIRFPDREIGPVVGGPVAYSSVAAARLGSPCGIVTVVAADGSDRLLRPLRKAGIDLTGVARRGQTRTSVLTYDECGNKRIDYVAIADTIRSEDVPLVYRDAAAFLLCPLDFEVSTDLVTAVKSAPGIVMLDLGGLGGVVSTRHPVGDVATAREVGRLVAGADVVKASLEDCAAIVGRSDPFQAARALARLGSTNVIVTCGESGLVVHDGRTSEWISAFRVDALDVTGAGDVFCGAFLVELLRAMDLHAAATFGAAAAAWHVAGTGGVAMDRAPTDAQVRRFMERAVRS